ncbi:MAG: thioredoxin domain-containing protein [Candidatus Paceibacterota bacterium]|jgi:hypothetical protein
MKKATIISMIIGVLVVIGIIWSVTSYNNTPGQYDPLAVCLKDKGAIFYGAFWCPHCQNQKKAFGKSARLLPYVECSKPDGRTQYQTCTDAKIESYPTWIFADGERIIGEITPEKLAEKTSCPLSGNLATTTATTGTTTSL